MNLGPLTSNPAFFSIFASHTSFQTKERERVYGCCGGGLGGREEEEREGRKEGVKGNFLLHVYQMPIF